MMFQRRLQYGNVAAPRELQQRAEVPRLTPVRLQRWNILCAQLCFAAYKRDVITLLATLLFQVQGDN